EKSWGIQTNNIGNFRLLELLPPSGTGTPRVTVVPGGNVGIGTVNPQAKIDVDGGVRVGVASDCNDKSLGCSNLNTGTLRYCDNQLEMCRSDEAGVYSWLPQYKVGDMVSCTIIAMSGPGVIPPAYPCASMEDAPWNTPGGPEVLACSPGWTKTNCHGNTGIDCCIKVK
ncbi:MAG: hypothetical protein JSW40_09445, partial [Candidatus Omnitrophota bacterium]